MQFHSSFIWLLTPNGGRAPTEPKVADFIGDKHVSLNFRIVWGYIVRLATTSTSINQCNYLFLDDIILLTRVLLTHWGRDEMAKGVIDTIRPKRDGQHFADDIFKCILLNENIWISLRISQKYVLKVRIDSISALFQTMTWRPSDDKPLSETKLATHICVTRPQWVKVFSIYIYIYKSRDEITSMIRYN